MFSRQMPPWRMSAAAKAAMISAIPRTPLHPTTWSPMPGVFLPPHPTPWQEDYSHYIQRILAVDAARADEERSVRDWQMKQRSARKDILDVHPYVDAAASSTVPPSSAVDTASPDRRLTPQGAPGVPPPPPPLEASSAAASFIDPEASRCFFLMLHCGVHRHSHADSAALRQCNCGVYRHSQNLFLLLYPTPAIPQAKKFFKVGKWAP